MGKEKNERFNRYYFGGRATMVIDQGDPKDFIVAFAFCSPRDTVNKKFGRKVAAARLDKNRFRLPVPRELVKEQKGLYGAIAYIMQGLYAKTHKNVLKMNEAGIENEKKMIVQKAREDGAPFTEEQLLDFAEANLDKRIRKAVYDSLKQSLGVPYWFIRNMLRTPVLRRKVESTPANAKVA